MGYIFLLLTILSESAAIVLMKFSDGFEHRMYTLFAVLCYGATFVFLTLALKRLPAGTTNATWAGASTVLVAVLGYYWLDEKLNGMQVASLGLIAIGLIGLNIKTN